MNKIKQFFTETLKSRAARNGAFAGAFSALMIVIIVAVNLLVGLIPARYTKLDFTNARIFSLSSQTTQALEDVKQSVQIYYITITGQEDLAITSLLEKYDELSPNISVQNIDAILNPTFGAVYGESVGVGTVIVEGESGKVRVISSSEFYTETFDELTYTQTVSFAGEEEITSAILYATTEDLPMVYTTEGHGEIILSDAYLQSLAGANIQTAQLNLLAEGAIPEDADLVFINAPLSDFSNDEADMLRDYLSGGGNVIFLTNFGEYNTEDYPMPNLAAIAKEYNLASQDGIIFEGNGEYHVSDYPHFLLPHVVPHELTQPLLENFVLTPLAHGIETIDSMDDDVIVYPLLTTTEDAFIKADAYTDNTTTQGEDDEKGPFDVAVLSENVVNGSKFVWLPSSGFADDDMDAIVSGSNRSFFINVISYCTGFEKGISFEAKPLITEVLTVPESFANLWGIVFTLIVPLAILAIGFSIWYTRRRR